MLDRVTWITLNKYISRCIFTSILILIFLNQSIFCQTNDERLPLSSAYHLSSDTIPLISPHIVCNGDTIHALWFSVDMMQTVTDDGIQYCHSFDGGETFSIKTTLVRADITAGPGLIASSNYFVYVTYFGFINGQLGTALTQSQDAGITWENPIMLLPNTFPLLIYAHDSTVYIHYQNQRGGKGGILRSNNNGIEWNNINSNMVLLNDIKISGKIMYAVGTITLSRSEIGLFYSYDRGTKWIGPEILSSEDRTPSTNPRLALNALGSIYVAWNDTGNVILRRTDGYDADNNLIWLPQTIISSDQHAVFLDIASSGKFVIAVWDNQSNTSKIIQSAFSIDGGNTFIQFDTLSENTNAGEPLMAVSKNKIHFIWSEELDSTQHIIYRRGTVLESQLPASFILRQNYPNPVNGITHIEYDIPATDHVRLVLYNLLGQKVATLIDEIQEQSRYNIPLDGNLFPSGVYFYRLTTSHTSQTKKMLILR